ncbi:DUF2357 domain-containing protein [Vibrio breoganii]
MPDILWIKTLDWELAVWTKDVRKPQKRLATTLKARNKETKPTKISFTPPLCIHDVTCEGATVCIPPLHIASNHLKVSHPLFFENTQYEFEFSFSEEVDTEEELTPRLLHKLNSVNSSFHFSNRVRAALRGSINFANDIGQFKLPFSYFKNKKKCKALVTLEVLPLKMDMTSDLAAMYRKIDEEYPLWRFALAEKTQQDAGSTKTQQQTFPLFWLAQFEALWIEYEKGIKLIINSPHNRLQPYIKRIKADKLKGKMSPRLTEKVSETLHRGSDDYRFTVRQKILSIDTPENRFIKMTLEHAHRNLGKLSLAAWRNEAKKDQKRLSRVFFERLSKWQNNIEAYTRSQIFKEIGRYDGLLKESLVLHQKTGYANVYRVWQQLKLYLDVLGKQSSISMKSIAELYEVWCFLEIRQQILDLGFVETKSQKAALKTKGLEYVTENGFRGAFNFQRNDGVTIRLAHEPRFTKITKYIKSWITPQQPDILLEVQFTTGERIVWLFDAKYRIETNDRNTTVQDMAPDDAINQMHRYRDALIQNHNDENGLTYQTRPVFGAYILYPGYMEQRKENAHENPYYEAINHIGIGAFPLLPSQKNATGGGTGNAWLNDFLNSKIGSLKASIDDSHIEECTRIPYIGTKNIRYSDLVAIMPLRDAGSASDDNFRTGIANIYSLKISLLTLPSVVTEIRYLAIPTTEVAGRQRIDYLYPVIGVESNVPDWLFTLGPGLKLTSPIEGEIICDSKPVFTSADAIWSECSWDLLPKRYRYR